MIFRRRKNTSVEMLWSISCQTVSGRGPSLSYGWGEVAFPRKRRGVEQFHWRRSMRASHRNFSSWQSQLSIITFSNAHTFIFSFSHIIIYAHVSFPVYLPHHHWRRLKRTLGVFSFTPPLSPDALRADIVLGIPPIRCLDGSNVFTTSD